MDSANTTYDGDPTPVQLAELAKDFFAYDSDGDAFMKQAMACVGGTIEAHAVAVKKAAAAESRMQSLPPGGSAWSAALEASMGHIGPRNDAIIIPINARFAMADYCCPNSGTHCVMFGPTDEKE